MGFSLSFCDSTATRHMRSSITGPHALCRHNLRVGAKSRAVFVASLHRRSALALPGVNEAIPTATDAGHGRPLHRRDDQGGLEHFLTGAIAVVADARYETLTKRLNATVSRRTSNSAAIVYT